MKLGDLVLVPRQGIIATDRCEVCKHAHEVFGSGGPTLYCRRFPPAPFPVIVMGPEGPQQAGTVSNWPAVLPDQACGEFKRKIHHGHASAG